MALAAQIAAQPPDALRATTRLLPQAAAPPWPAAIERENAEFATPRRRPREPGRHRGVLHRSRDRFRSRHAAQRPRRGTLRCTRRGGLALGCRRTAAQAVAAVAAVAAGDGERRSAGGEHRPRRDHGRGDGAPGGVASRRGRSDGGGEVRRRARRRRHRRRAVVVGTRPRGVRLRRRRAETTARRGRRRPPRLWPATGRPPDGTTAGSRPRRLSPAVADVIDALAAEGHPIRSGAAGENVLRRRVSAGRRCARRARAGSAGAGRGVAAGARPARSNAAVVRGRRLPSASTATRAPAGAGPAPAVVDGGVVRRAMPRSSSRDVRTSERRLADDHRSAADGDAGDGVGHALDPDAEHRRAQDLGALVRARARRPARTSPWRSRCTPTGPGGRAGGRVLGDAGAGHEHPGRDRRRRRRRAHTDVPRAPATAGQRGRGRAGAPATTAGVATATTMWRRARCRSTRPARRASAPVEAERGEQVVDRLERLDRRDRLAHPPAGAVGVELDGHGADAALERDDRPTGAGRARRPSATAVPSTGWPANGSSTRRREDADAGVAGGRVRRRVDEHGLGEADLAGEVLAQLPGHRGAVGEHRQLVAGEGAVGEDVERGAQPVMRRLRLAASSRAWARSASRSSACSRPTETRTRPSAMPSSARSPGVRWPTIVRRVRHERLGPAQRQRQAGQLAPTRRTPGRRRARRAART